MQVQEQAALALARLLALEEDEIENAQCEGQGVGQQRPLQQMCVGFGAVVMLLNMVTSGVPASMQAAGVWR